MTDLEGLPGYLQQLVERADALPLRHRMPQATATARRSAVLILFGEGPDGPDLVLIEKSVHLRSHAGQPAFPGGGVDPRDFDQEIAWAGPSAEEWADLLDTSPSHARALVCAAVRETFEESGVLLAGPTPGTVVAGTGPGCRRRRSAGCAACSPGWRWPGRWWRPAGAVPAPRTRPRSWLRWPSAPA